MDFMVLMLMQQHYQAEFISIQLMQEVLLKRRR